MTLPHKPETNPQEGDAGVQVRAATTADATAVMGLLTELGYPSSEPDVTRRLDATVQSQDTVAFVAEVAGQVVGVVSFHCIPLFHAEGCLGRVTSLAVTASCRQRGVGRALVLAAEAWGATRGCRRYEVTSGDHRADAHAFYERIGYRMDCRRFVKRNEEG